jgi:hypothetical protein
VRTAGRGTDQTGTGGRAFGGSLTLRVRVAVAGPADVRERRSCSGSKIAGPAGGTSNE